MSKKKERGVVCMFCGEGFGYAGQTPDETTLKAAYDHEAQCPNNPYRAQIAALARDLAEARAARDAERAQCVFQVVSNRPPVWLSDEAKVAWKRGQAETIARIKNAPRGGEVGT